MSVQVMSAILDCRDTSLEAAKRMVLIAIANYAGEDGRAWPSQERIAADSGIALRTCKRHIKWLEDNGFLSRQTKHLGQGNGSRTTYCVHVKRLSGTVTDTSGQDETNAGAKFARANSCNWEGQPRPLTNRQEPSKPSKKKTRERISRDWLPNDSLKAYALAQGIHESRLSECIEDFADFFSSPNSKIYSDYAQVWRGHCRRNSQKFSRPKEARNGNRASTYRPASQRHVDPSPFSRAVDEAVDILADQAPPGRDGPQHHGARPFPESPYDGGDTITLNAGDYAYTDKLAS